MKCKHAWIHAGGQTIANHDLKNSSRVDSIWCSKCGTLRVLRYRVSVNAYGHILSQDKRDDWKQADRYPSDLKLRKS